MRTACTFIPYKHVYATYKCLCKRTRRKNESRKRNVQTYLATRNRNILPLKFFHQRCKNYITNSSKFIINKKINKL